MRWIVLIGLLGCGGEALTVQINYPIQRWDVVAHTWMPGWCDGCGVIAWMSPEEYASLKYTYQYTGCTFRDLDGDRRFINCSAMTCGMRPPGLRQDACGWEPPR